MAAKKDKSSSESEENQTESNTSTESSNELAKITDHLLATGLEDYGFWWKQMLKEQADKPTSDESSDKSFRRGRIWS